MIFHMNSIGGSSAISGAFCAGTDGGGRAEGQSGTAGSIPEADSGGRICTGKLCGNLDAVINEMNATTPDVIVSILPSPLQGTFFAGA